MPISAIAGRVGSESLMQKNMLAAYYSKGTDSEQMFSGLRISKDADFKKHLNKYDVIHIDIQWFLANCDDADKVVSFL